LRRRPPSDVCPPAAGYLIKAPATCVRLLAAKSNTSTERQLSLFRQGLYGYQAMPTTRPERLEKLLTAFDRSVAELAIGCEIFGVIGGHDSGFV
jgi:hypothetical protein